MNVGPVMARFKSLQSRKRYAVPTKINIPTPQNSWNTVPAIIFFPGPTISRSTTHVTKINQPSLYT